VDDHCGAKDDRAVYVDDSENLFSCESMDDFSKMLQVKETSWSEAFLDYFRSRILSRADEYGARADEYGAWAVDKLVTGKHVTTNQSEGFNTLLHSLQDWKEVPLDVVILSLQMYFHNEICRGKCGLGNYTLKSCYIYRHHVPQSGGSCINANCCTT
jgi:hypothetical protein